MKSPLDYRFDRSLQLTLDALNLFDRKTNDIEYWGAERRAATAAAASTAGWCTRSNREPCASGRGSVSELQ